MHLRGFHIYISVCIKDNKQKKKRKAVFIVKIEMPGQCGCAILMQIKSKKTTDIMQPTLRPQTAANPNSLCKHGSVRVANSIFELYVVSLTSFGNATETLLSSSVQYEPTLNCLPVLKSGRIKREAVI